MTAATTFRANDVVRYTPRDRFDRWWCREGKAVAMARGDDVILVDTYWNLSGSSDYVLTDDEAASAQVLFNMEDFDAIDQYDHGARDKWAKYAPEDRAEFSAQHGLQHRYFIRKGAQPSLAQQILNAREAVGEAEREVSSAQWTLDLRRQDLAKLEAQQVSA